MSRRSVALVSMLSAVLACAITAAAFIAIDHGSDESQVVPTSFSADPASQLAAPTPPPDVVSAEPDPTAGYTRPAVDWSTIFAKVSSSVVAVYTSESAGSGFFVSEDGHIITNWHVVEDMAEIRIVMTDGTRADAEYIAKDLGNDLALLKIDARELDIDVLEYGKVEDLRVGDPVAALGAPYALPNTLTVGIISALDRLRPSGSGTWEPLRATIQTDAALNPGNSGGMLVDRFGRVIGIPTQIESPDRTSSGVGFAVSADAMLLALPTLIERGRRGAQLPRRDVPDTRLTVGNHRRDLRLGSRCSGTARPRPDPARQRRRHQRIRRLTGSHESDCARRRVHDHRASWIAHAHARRHCHRLAD